MDNEPPKLDEHTLGRLAWETWIGSRRVPLVSDFMGYEDLDRHAQEKWQQCGEAVFNFAQSHFQTLLQQFAEMNIGDKAEIENLDAQLKDLRAWNLEKLLENDDLKEALAKMTTERDRWAKKATDTVGGLIVKIKPGHFLDGRSERSEYFGSDFLTLTEAERRGLVSIIRKSEPPPE